MTKGKSIRLGGASAPCLGCTEHVSGCHTACARYKEFRAQADDALKLRYEYNLAHAPTDSALRRARDNTDYFKRQGKPLYRG